MRAVLISTVGGPEVLQIRDVPDPIPGPGQVRVRVRAAALNRADLLQRLGRHPAPEGSPADIPGLEFAGEVDECGDAVRGVRLGSRVMGIVGGGGQAERVCVSSELCLPVPDDLNWEQAAAIPEAFVTAYDALFRLGNCEAGHTVVVHAAGSGVGTAAVQLAAAAGARVVALSRTASKRERLLRLGATQAFDPGDHELAGSVRDGSPGRRGADLVLDLVGAAAWPGNLAMLRERGRIVVVGLLGGSRADTDLGLLLRRRLSVVGTAMRSRPLEEKAALVREAGRHILPLLRSGEVVPVLDRCFPLDRVSEAHAYLAGNANFGKVVLTPLSVAAGAG